MFKDDKWQHNRAPIDEFDAAFIADNVFAGEMIALRQDRGLFSIIIGEEGVRLANLLERFNAHAKAAAWKLKDAETALEDDLPSDFSREPRFALAPNSAYADRLKAEKALIRARRILDKLIRDEAAAPRLVSCLADVVT